MSGQLTPRMTVLSATVRETVEDVPDLDARPSFVACGAPRSACRRRASRAA